MAQMYTDVDTSGTTVSIAARNKAKRYLQDQSAVLTPTEIVSIFRKAEAEWVQDSYGEPNKYQSAKKLSVLDYFNLNDSIDTDLKRKAFQQTSKYSTLMDSVKQAKNAFFTTTFYEYGFNDADLDPRNQSEYGDEDEPDNPGSYVFVNQQPTSDYNLAKKGFELTVADRDNDGGCSINALHGVIAGVEFKQLPVYYKSDSRGSYQTNINRYEMLFVPMNEQIALEVENERNHISILRVFNIFGDYTATIPNATYYDPDTHAKAPCKAQVIKGGTMRLIIYHTKTNKIYFDKLYPALSR